METSIGIGVLCCFLMIFVVAIVAGKRHARAMKAFAESIGFSYVPHAEDDEEFLRPLSRLPLFSLGRERDVWNMMTGKANDYHVTILDFRYSYNTASRQSIGEVSTQTVVVLDLPQQDIPTFSLRPHRRKDEVGKTLFSALIPGLAQLTPQDIDFPTHPVFSDCYLLHGTRKNEAAVRSLFRDDVIEYFENHRGLCADGAGTQFECYKRCKELSPKDIMPLLNQAVEVSKLLRAADASFWRQLSRRVGAVAVRGGWGRQRPLRGRSVSPAVRPV